MKDLNYWLPHFITEVRKVDGKPYPPRTIHQILAGLQRHMLDLNYCSLKFLDRQDQIFKPIHSVCDSVYHSLHTSGIGTSVRHTSVITTLEEDKLWDCGIFGINDQKSLQRTVFFSTLIKDFAYVVEKNNDVLVHHNLCDLLVLIVSLM